MMVTHHAIPFHSHRCGAAPYTKVCVTPLSFQCKISNSNVIGVFNTNPTNQLGDFSPGALQGDCFSNLQVLFVCPRAHADSISGFGCIDCRLNSLEVVRNRNNLR